MDAVALTLTLLALAGGAVAGAVAALRRRGPALRLRVAFVVYLGGLAVLSTTWAQSMEVLPLALVFGAAVGILPFAAMFLLVRQLVRQLLRWLLSRRQSVAALAQPVDPEPPQR